jgi:hypothetical protein
MAGGIDNNLSPSSGFCGGGTYCARGEMTVVMLWWIDATLSLTRVRDARLA